MWWRSGGSSIVRGKNCSRPVRSPLGGFWVSVTATQSSGCLAVACDCSRAVHRACSRRALTAWVPRAIGAARAAQPLWSQPDAKPPRFEDGLEAAKHRFSGILSGLALDSPKELAQ